MAITESLFSSSKNHIFPSSQQDRASIPLWLKFFCYEYSDNSLYRAFANSGAGLMLKSVMLPAPKEFVTKTDNVYDTGLVKDDKSTLTTADPQSADSLSDFAFAGGARAVARGTEFLNFPQWIAETLDVGVKIDMDMSDAKFRGVNKRLYNFKVILAARSVQDSNLASTICDAFEAYSLPQARFGLFSKFVSHPPLWKFGIGPAGNEQIDRSWSGQPQLCVLDQITVSKTGFQDNYGISDESGNIKPICQTINMTFVELEPALRKFTFGGSSDIINRSSSFYQVGGLGASVVR